MIPKITLYTLLVVGLTAVVAGCGKPPEAPPQAQQQASQTHPHKEGLHQGVIVEVGRDNHVEAVFEKDGVIRLYTLGKDEAVVQEVDAQAVNAYVKSDDGAEATVAFESDPQKSDPQGKTTRDT